jgi:hypothetical protein
MPAVQSVGGHSSTPFVANPIVIPPGLHSAAFWEPAFLPLHFKFSGKTAASCESQARTPELAPKQSRAGRGQAERSSP